MELTGIRKALSKNENLVAIIIVAITIVISLITPAFFSLENLFDVLQACIVNGILATAVLLVLISGGIDVSCLDSYFQRLFDYNAAEQS